jgi:hypothetical protein
MLLLAPAPTFGVVVFGFITVHRHPADLDADYLDGRLIGLMWRTKYPPINAHQSLTASHSLNST